MFLRFLIESTVIIYLVLIFRTFVCIQTRKQSISNAQGSLKENTIVTIVLLINIIKTMTKIIEIKLDFHL